MRIVFINSVSFGSTGNIVINLASEFSKDHDVYFCFPRSRSNSILKPKNYKVFMFGNLISRSVDRLFSYLFGIFGVFSVFPTFRLILFLKIIKPQVVHLHNLHGNYLNLPLLFMFLNRNNSIKVVWTFHDTWPFTGHCSHYSAVGCSKFIDGCYKCPLYNKHYPKSVIDNSSFNYVFKMKYFTSLKKLTIITPSIWLQNEVKKSFFMNKKIIVIPNGVDKNQFRRISTINKNSYGRKINLLFVASVWNKNKGIEIIHDLANMLNKDQFNLNIIGVVKNKIYQPNVHYYGLIKDPLILNEMYNKNDIFINPSIEETFSLVTAEAICSGIPVIVSNKTALPELVRNKNGEVILFNNAKDFLNVINKFNILNYNYSADHIITKFEMTKLYLTEYSND